ncbi:MAG: PfkB family carbohydrate kinase [Pseudomonadota bacterium]
MRHEEPHSPGSPPSENAVSTHRGRRRRSTAKLPSTSISTVQTDDATAAARSLATDQRVIAMTRGPRGSLICHGEEFEEILPRAVEEVVDTTGAGDLYAAGFLHGHVQGLKFRACGEIGSIAAAEVISHMGARPEQSLSELVSSLKT